MPVNGINGGSNTPQTQYSAPILGKDDFLQLLTTKLRYQDPMNPMEDHEFIAQLAQFSSLEQMQNINETMQTQILLTQSTNNALATSLIGKDVQALGNSISLEEAGTAEISMELQAAADVTVRIYDKDGTVVRTLAAGSMEAGVNSTTWDGLDTGGESLPAGTYTYEVTAIASDKTTVGVTTYTTGHVTGVEFVNGAAELLVNGVHIPLSDVIRIDEI